MQAPDILIWTRFNSYVKGLRYFSWFTSWRRGDEKGFVSKPRMSNVSTRKLLSRFLQFPNIDKVHIGRTKWTKCNFPIWFTKPINHRKCVEYYCYEVRLQVSTNGLNQFGNSFDQ